MKINKLNSLNILVRAFYDYQRERLRLDGILGKKKDGTDKKGTPERDPALLLFLAERREELYQMEIGLEKDIVKALKNEPIWIHFLKDIKGIGPVIGGVIITQIDIHKAPQVSNIVSFAGLAPGKDRKEKGKKCPYNQFLRAKLCGVLGSSFLKANSPYREYYDFTKHRLENSNAEVEERLRKEDQKKKEYKDMKMRTVKWKDAYPDHRHKAAIRKMIKEFLKDLYVAWRELEGLPIREPYSQEYLNKRHAA